MEGILSAAPPFQLAACSFFVAWRGVLTLAFHGFPVSVVDMKKQLMATCNLAPEQSGSKWPKSTLAAVKSHKELSVAQFQILCQLCAECSCELQGVDVTLHCISAVDYGCRSLEVVSSRQDFLLEGPVNNVVEASDQQFVRDVLQEMHSPDYWALHVTPPGNRDDHYRVQHEGRTLVSFLIDSKDAAMLLAKIRAFRDAVDAALPGVYSWLDESSLHVTSRAL